MFYELHSNRELFPSIPVKDSLKKSLSQWNPSHQLDAVRFILQGENQEIRRATLYDLRVLVGSTYGP